MQVLTVKGNARYHNHIEEEVVAQALSILELAVIYHAEQRALNDEHVNMADGETRAKIGNTSKIGEIYRSISEMPKSKMSKKYLGEMKFGRDGIEIKERS